MPTSPPHGIEAERNKQIAAALSRLALHYWRPDFTPSQAALLIEDFLDDLKDFSVQQVINACAEYRRDGSNKFFPTPGALMEAVQPDREPSPWNIAPYRAPRLESPRKPLRSVSEILRDAGFEREAAKYEAAAQKLAGLSGSQEG